jgi:DNA-binding beta-propeller fold protein YncE
MGPAGPVADLTALTARVAALEAALAALLPPATCTDSNANNVGQPLPCTYPPPPPTTCTDSNANNVGQPLPCTYPPPPPTTCTDSNANNVGQPLPCTYDPPPPPTLCADPNADNIGQPLPCTYGDAQSDFVAITSTQYLPPTYTPVYTHRLFDVFSGAFISELQPAATNTSASFVGAGRVFAAVQSGFVRVFDAITHLQMGGDVPTGAYPDALELSPAGDRLYVLADNGVTVIDVASQSVVGTVTITMQPNSDSRISVAPDGKIYVLAQLSYYPVFGSQLSEIDPVTLTVTRTWNTGARQVRAVTAAGGHVYTVLNDSGGVYLTDLDVTSGATTEHSLGSGWYIISAHRSPDGSTIYATVGSYAGWQIYKLSGGVLTTVAQSNDALESAAYSGRTNRMLLSVSAYPSGSTKAVDLTTGVVTTFASYAGSLAAGALPSVQNGSLPSACMDPAASNYLQIGVCTYPPPPPTTCQDPNATNYNGPLPCTYPPPPPPPSVCADATANNVGSPLPCTYADGQTDFVAITSVQYEPPTYTPVYTHRLFDALSGAFISELQPAATNTSASFVGAGRVFAAVQSGFVRVFDAVTHLQTGSDIPTGTYPDALQLSPAGDRLYVIADNGVNVIDVASQSVVGTVAITMTPNSDARISVAPNGKIYVLAQLSFYPVFGSELSEIDPATLTVTRTWNTGARQVRAVTAGAGHVYTVLNDSGGVYLTDLDVTSGATTEHSLGSGWYIISAHRSPDANSIYATVGSYAGWQIYKLTGGVLTTVAQGSDSLESAAFSARTNRMLLSISAYPAGSTKAVDLTTGAITTFASYTGSLSAGALPPVQNSALPTACSDPAASNYLQIGVCTYPPPPPTTCQDPNASNYNGPLPCTYPPPPPPPNACADATATNIGSPLPCTFADGQSDFAAITTVEYLPPTYTPVYTHRLFDVFSGTFISELQPAATNTSASFVGAGKVFAAVQNGFVRVFDAITHQQTGSDVPTGTYPDALHLSPAGDRLYVVADNGVNVIDVASQSVVGTVAITMTPNSDARITVAPNGKIYVLAQLSFYPVFGSELSEIDPVTLTVTRTWNTGARQVRAVTAAGGHVYTVLNDPGGVYLTDLDVTSGATTAHSLGSGWYIISAHRSPDGNSIYATVGSYAGWQIYKLSGGVLTTVAQGNEGLESAALSGRTNRMLLSISAYPVGSTKAVNLSTGAITTFASYTGSLAVGALPPQ